MRVANKLTPETKNKTTKPGHGLGKNQVKTLQLLVPKSKRLGGYTEDTRESAPSCLCGADSSQASIQQIKKIRQDNGLHRVVYMAKTKANTQQIKRGCQHKDNMQSCSHGKVESKTKYSASQITLIAWTTHPKNKQGIQVERTSAKNLHSKGSIMSYYKARAQKSITSNVIIRGRDNNIKIIYNSTG